ncbi:PocR ligand-binding domain-containing protein [Inconstantimicrobium mannanitabidum]|uniref:Uncharacterized protein n=1 Tax=Inconstantimicrobium mannanitabidum TaxID=1604901 RepID=A0ACB5RCS2_9CLOT|nr:PocR ligand-binding domain-containing protein [Clostridium sp. TW13]GKX67072.1 hypothetical protein rsdtw13_23300 [Clostridium sp. TW13]
MENNRFLDLINVNWLKKMGESIYNAIGIPIGVIGANGDIIVEAGWQDICTKYHRVNPISCERCYISDKYISEHLKHKKYVEYKCLNNLWEAAIPIIIENEHIATVFFGQFFYEDEKVDIDVFRKQALEFGINEEEYLDALNKVPRFSKKKVEHIIEYYQVLVRTLVQSARRELEQKKSQKETEESKMYLDTIFNSVNDGIFINDIYGNIIDVNETAAAMFKYSRAEMIGKNANDILSRQSHNGKFDIAQLINEVKKINPLIVELVGKRSDTTEFNIELNLRVTKIGEDERAIVAVRNVTERKQLELALEHERLELEKLRTEFFANISHELRTPLNIILGSIQIGELMLEDEESIKHKEKVVKNLNIQKQNCFRLLRLINNLIDSTKLDAGYLDLNMVNCDIINVVEDITMSVAEYISNNNIKLIFDTDIEEKIIACDLDKIERILLNILSNCIKFTPDGGSISVNMYDGEEYVTIVIQDTGIGISDEKIGIIFDRFRQADRSFTRNHEGSGIGLSIVKSLVEMQGGTISAESKLGFGTKFIIKFPVRVLDNQENKENTGIVKNTINSHVERIKIEFSDIYK